MAVAADPSYITLSVTARPIMNALGEGAQVLIENQDLVNNAYVGYRQGIIAGANTITIPALGSKIISAERMLWGLCTTGSPVIAVIPGGTATQVSPAQIALQLVAQGLAKDSSVAAVNTTLGTPAQRSDLTTINTTLGTPAQNAALNTINSTLGAPAQASGLTTINTTLGAPAQASGLTTINTTLGTPAQKADVNAVNTTLGTPAQKADVNAVNTTLGTPAQTADIGNLHTAGKTVASEVSTTGVPLLRKSANLLNKTAQALAGAATSTQGPFTITQPSYQFWISVLSGVATIPFVKVNIQWSDSVTSQITSSENWYLAGGSSGAGTVFGNGPCRGDTLQIQLTNLDATVSATWGFIATQTSSVFAYDEWRQLVMPAVNGYSNPTVEPLSGLIWNTNGTITNASNITRLLPLYFGSISGFVATPAGDAGLLTINYPTGTIQASATTPVAQVPCAAGTQTIFEAAMGRGNMVIVLSNSGTTTATFQSGAVAKVMQP